MCRRYPSDPINPEHLSTVAITSPLYSIPCDKSKDRLFSQHATAPLSFSLCNTSESDGHASTSLSASSVPSTTSPLTVAELPASAMSSAEHLQEELGFTTVAKFTHEVKQKKRGRPADIGKFVKPVHSADANDMLSFLSTRFLTAYWTTPLSYFRYHSESKLLLQECLQQFLATVKDESEVKLEVNSERANMLASEHMVDLDWLKKWLFV
ncbi:hypothetical protein EON65_27685 [archaeon]|nr:MAG: hypothetical protein EON65_27685 [archaeon]